MNDLKGDLLWYFSQVFGYCGYQNHDDSNLATSIGFARDINTRSLVAGKTTLMHWKFVLLLLVCLIMRF
jgi:hypothetical protein